VEISKVNNLLNLKQRIINNNNQPYDTKMMGLGQLNYPSSS